MTFIAGASPGVAAAVIAAVVLIVMAVLYLLLIYFTTRKGNVDMQDALNQQTQIVMKK